VLAMVFITSAVEDGTRTPSLTNPSQSETHKET
jgi:hypothetical protein